MKRATQLGFLFLLIHSVYAYLVHVDLQHGSILLQWTTMVVDPVATLSAIKYDLDGHQYVNVLLFVGGAQWFVIGMLVAAWRLRIIKPKRRQ